MSSMLLSLGSCVKAKKQSKQSKNALLLELKNCSNAGCITPFHDEGLGL